MRDDLLQRVLSVMAAGSGKAPSWEDLIAQLGEADPRAQLITQYLAAQEDARSRDEANGDGYEVEAEARFAPADADQRETQRSRLRRMIFHMREELAHLRESNEDLAAELEACHARNDMLAAALGACHLCWGGDLACETCRGRGRPGFLEPDWPLFAELVMPAARRRKHRRPAGEPSHPAREQSPISG